jgi:hypothetical protein
LKDKPIESILSNLYAQHSHIFNDMSNVATKVQVNPVVKAEAVQQPIQKAPVVADDGLRSENMVLNSSIISLANEAGTLRVVGTCVVFGAGESKVLGHDHSALEGREDERCACGAPGASAVVS